MISKNNIWLLLIIIIQGCGVYSFTGTTLSPDVETISIQTFFNDTDQGPPNMGQIFSDKLRDFYQQNTSLILVQEDGDLQLEGVITSYRLSPVAPTAAGNQQLNDQSRFTRLTITVQASYVNTLNENDNFERSFSFFDDFDNSTQTLTQVEDQLLETIFDQIILDIFNASVAVW